MHRLVRRLGSNDPQKSRKTGKVKAAAVCAASVVRGAFGVVLMRRYLRRRHSFLDHFRRAVAPSARLRHPGSVRGHGGRRIACGARARSPSLRIRGLRARLVFRAVRR